ncbi:MAG: methylated-DNA--[protein]-cysteine S-methyltransferase [Sphingosinicella sp.]|nr:methylated-DNA--[protein]-cysteine S-methyltransferase [Sphingosinicella sp.]
MTNAAFTLFDTPIGRCAILWRGALVIGASLAEADDQKMRQALRRRFPEARAEDPPPVIAAAIEAVVRLLSGEREDFAGIQFDLSAVPEFDRRVLEACFAIPPGETRTYGDIARQLGAPGAARAVGRALGHNPIPIIIPCHRVLASDGKSGGFSAPGGAATKLKMLRIERARRGDHPMLFDELEWSVAPGPRPA